MDREKNKVKTICVYCGANPAVAQKYKDAAAIVGQSLAEAGYNIVYGGGQSGLMGIVANTALQHGAHVTGIIPGHIDEREIRHEKLSELHVVESMHERKAMMANRSDVFLILPGGMGTMDEFFEITTWRQLGLHDKSIIVYNVEKYWENLKLLLDTIANESFMKPEDKQHFYISDDLADIMDKIKQAPLSIKDVNNKKI